MRWPGRAADRAAMADDVDRSFAALVSEGARTRAAARVGIEHEYRVVGEDGAVDFRDLIRDLDLGTAFLDPRDAFGFRLASGTWLTCDDAEAELAMPPVALEAGFGATLASTAARARADLERLLPHGLALDGFSTHINVTAANERRHEAARLFARTFAPALMLLMDRSSSPGLLVRSRPGRIELGGEFIEGAGLVSAALLAAGGVLACLRALSRRWPRARLPSQLRVRSSPEWRRYGWYVDRRAFGPDLYAEGRGAILRTLDGAPVSAQEQLEQAWRIARRELPRGIDRSDRARVDAIVSGRVRLAVEAPDGARDERAPVDLPSAGTLYASAIRPRSRERFELGAVLSTWELTVFVIVDRALSRRAFACVPDAFLARFLALLDSGALDRVVEHYLRSTRGSRRLDDMRQARLPGLWDELGPRRSLLRPEIRPQGARP